jgi:hypothetical protein
MLDNLSATSAANAAQEQRIAQLLRAYQRVLRRKPTLLEFSRGADGVGQCA